MVTRPFPCERVGLGTRLAHIPTLTSELPFILDETLLLDIGCIGQEYWYWLFTMLLNLYGCP